MKLTKKQEEEIIDIFSLPEISKEIKITFLRLIMNNDIEMLLAKIKGRLENERNMD